jgi:hypothetical protein
MLARRGAPEQVGNIQWSVLVAWRVADRDTGKQPDRVRQQRFPLLMNELLYLFHPFPAVDRAANDVGFERPVRDALGDIGEDHAQAVVA